MPADPATAEDLPLDPRLTDLDAARHVAALNRASRGRPVGRDAGVEAVRAAVRIPRDPDGHGVSSRDALIHLADRVIAVRLYRPDAHTGGCIVFFHGGGWMLGDLDTNDTLCRELSRASGASVVSVDYRLAPEHPYPAALDDAAAALRWVSAGADGELPGTDRIGVAGHSAGGNLAAVLAQRSARGELPSVAHQLLLCATLDLGTLRESHRENGEGLLLTTAEMEWYRELYLPDPGLRLDPSVSPLRAPDLSGLPPATLVIASGDPLRDEELEYAQRLRAAGVPVTTHVAVGVPHLFLTFPPMPVRDSAIEAATLAARAHLSRDA